MLDFISGFIMGIVFILVLDLLKYNNKKYNYISLKNENKRLEEENKTKTEKLNALKLVLDEWKKSEKQ